MSAHTVARMLTDDSATAERIERLLKGRPDAECEAIVERLDDLRPLSATPFAGDQLVRAVEAARDMLARECANDLDRQPDAEGSREISQAARLVQLGREAELFCSQNGHAHASV